MFRLDDFIKLWLAMLALGQRRLIIIAAVVLTTVAAVVGGGYLLSAPEMEVAYVGLAPQDVSRIGRALSEAGMAFDVSSDSTRLMTRRGETARCSIKWVHWG